MKSNWLESASKAIQKDALFDWRQAQLNQVITDGFPTRKNELWKYTDVSAIANTDFIIQQKSVLNDSQAESVKTLPDTIGIVFVDGVLSTDLSLFSGIDGLTIQSTMDAVASGLLSESELRCDVQSGAPFIALNNALFHTGVYLSVERNAKIDRPIHILHIQSDNAQPKIQSVRHMVSAQSNSELTIFEEFKGTADMNYFNNVVTQIKAEVGARISHYRLQNESSNASHIAKILIDQAGDSQVDTYHFNLGGKLARHDLHYRFKEKGAFAKMIGLYAGSDKQHLDSHTLVEHIAPHCQSDQVYRGVLSDAAHGVFNGKIKVYPDAQKTQADLNNRNLLLSKKAQVDTKPELEIDADDVKCSHGATVGCIDPTALFYLRSRGIEEQAARELLIQAFLTELFDGLPNAQIQSYIQSVVMDDAVR